MAGCLRPVGKKPPRLRFDCLASRHARTLFRSLKKNGTIGQPKWKLFMANDNCVAIRDERGRYLKGIPGGSGRPGRQPQ
jgi:hypothetical protein